MATRRQIHNARRRARHRVLRVTPVVNRESHRPNDSPGAVKAMKAVKGSHG